MDKNDIKKSFVRESITGALLELMKKQEFEDITISDLVNRAGVGRASFYRNYISKEDVLKKELEKIIKWLYIIQISRI